MLMMKKNIIFILSLFIFVFLISCSRTETPADIGIEVCIDLKEPLYEFTFIDIPYNWSFNDPDFEYSPDIKVFFHLWHMGQNRMVLQDDHDLPLISLIWPDKLEYSRRIFVPYIVTDIDKDFKGQEDIRISIGLYSSAGGKLNALLYRENFTFLALPYIYPRIVFHGGWHGLEEHAAFRWTGRRAGLAIDNKGHEMEFHLNGSVMKDIIADQRITVSFDNNVLEEFIPQDKDFYRIILIPKTSIEDNGEIYLYISVDKTFIPSEIGINPNDNRELGIMVKSVHFQPKQLKANNKTGNIMQRAE